MKVEVGGGASALAGYRCVDMNPRFADVVADVRRLPFADATVTSLRAVDILEHLSYRDTEAVLAEWARVCAPGADVYIQVPNGERIMRLYVEGDERLTVWERDQRCDPLWGAQWRLLGGHVDGVYAHEGDPWHWNAHAALFSEESLTAALDQAGFDVKGMKTNGFPNIMAAAVRR